MQPVGKDLNYCEPLSLTHLLETVYLIRGLVRKSNRSRHEGFIVPFYPVRAADNLL